MSDVRVLFISKPIVPPFQDGTKCLVRDIARGLTRVTPVVMGTRGASGFEDAPNVERAAVYSADGGHGPAFLQNLRAFGWVLARSRADVWHFVFAPNPRTSKVGRSLKRFRGTPVVQTIASQPREFGAVDELLFGDVIVAQSQFTAQRVRTVFAEKGRPLPRTVVIPPPVPTELGYAPERLARARAELGIPEDAPLFIYPGDLEVSRGAKVTAAIARELPKRVPGAITVFAYRKKTAHAEGFADELRRSLDPASTRVISTLPDVKALIAAATAVVFPVDDLYGKVDLPIVLLESMVLGVPVVALGEGPLCDLTAAELVPSLDPKPWLDVLAGLAEDSERRRALSAAQRRFVSERHAASVVAKAYEDLYVELAPGVSRPR